MELIKYGGMQEMEDIDSNPSTDTASTLSELGFTVAKSATVDNTVDKADFALIYIELNSVRFGKGAPSITLGIVVNHGQIINLDSAKEIEETKFISAIAGAPATINAQIGYSR